MGWFLTKPKSRAASRATPRVQADTWNPHITWMLLHALFVLLLLGGIGLAWFYFEPRLLDYARQQRQTKVDETKVLLVNRPAWMNDTLLLYFQQQVASRVNPDPMDQASLAQAVQALASDPWVKAVHRLIRTPAGQLQLQAEFRRPVALVQWKDRFHLLDDQGVQLPGNYTAEQARTLPLPRILGVSSPPQGEGRPWTGDDLQAGLSLMLTLADQDYAAQIVEYDVSSRDARGRMRLVMRTHNGGQVRWGLPPGQEQAIEPTAQVKKTWLADLQQKKGSIDVGGRIVDIFGAAVFIHQPQAQDAVKPAGYSKSQ